MVVIIQEVGLKYFKMKKTTITIMIAILGLSLVSAGIIGVSLTNRTIDLDKPVRDTLTARGFDNITYKDFEIGDDEVKRTMYQRDVINTFVRVKTYYMECLEWEGEEYLSECLNSVRRDYTDQEVKEMLDTKVANKLKRISEDTPTPTITKVAEGDLITRERR